MPSKSTSYSDLKRREREIIAAAFAGGPSTSKEGPSTPSTSKAVASGSEKKTSEKQKEKDRSRGEKSKSESKKRKKSLEKPVAKKVGLISLYFKFNFIYFNVKFHWFTGTSRHCL